MPEANSQKGGPIFYTCYTETVFAESILKFSFCLGISFCMRKSPFHILKCWKSFDLKLSFVYTLKLFRGPFAHNFCFILINYLLQNLLNMALERTNFNRTVQKLSAKLSKGRDDRLVRLPSYPPLIIRIEFCQSKP